MGLKGCFVQPVFLPCIDEMKMYRRIKFKKREKENVQREKKQELEFMTVSDKAPHTLLPMLAPKL